MRTLIVSAGKNTRFGDEKALQKINNIENIVNTYNVFSPFSTHMYVAIRQEKEMLYKNVLPKATFILLTNSFGEGQAVRDSLQQLPNDKYLIVWGDMVIQDNTFVKPFLQETIEDRLNVLTKYENNPGLCYITDEHSFITAPLHPGKRAFNIPRGINDKGVYVTNRNFILPFLNELKVNEDGEYKMLESTISMYQHGVPAKAIVIDSTNIQTFNTIQELKKIKG